MNTSNAKAKAKEFFMKHKWEILAVILLTTGVGAVSYRMAFKKGELKGLLMMFGASYRDNQQLACYTDQLVETWTKENRALLAERGDEMLKCIGEELSKRAGAA